MQIGGGHHRMRNPNRRAIAPFLDVHLHGLASCIYDVDTVVRRAIGVNSVDTYAERLPWENGRRWPGHPSSDGAPLSLAARMAFSKSSHAMRLPIRRAMVSTIASSRSAASASRPASRPS